MRCVSKSVTAVKCGGANFFFRFRPAMISAGKKWVFTTTSHDCLSRNLRSRPRCIRCISRRRLVGLLLGRRLPVEHVVEVAQHVRHPIHHVEIRLPVKAAEHRIGELEHIDILHVGLGIKLLQRRFDGLGRAQMPRADRRRQNQDAARHAEIPRTVGLAGPASTPNVAELAGTRDGLTSEFREL